MEKINGETITGIALVFLAILFIYAGTVNNIWATIFPADFLILAIGAAFIILGMWDIRKKRRIGHVKEQGENSYH
jgi:putative Ca2+/H+ antiporter (TMEM165/GDT1 family)